MKGREGVSDTASIIKYTKIGRLCQVDKKTFSERLFETVMELIASEGPAKVAESMGLQSNYFAPSKYGFERFRGKAIDHLDRVEEYFGVDLLGGLESGLALEVNRADSENVLTQHDRMAIRSLIEAARARSAMGARGAEAVEKIRRTR